MHVPSVIVDLIIILRINLRLINVHGLVQYEDFTRWASERGERWQGEEREAEVSVQVQYCTVEDTLHTQVADCIAARHAQH